jgi:hypothetical protein
VAAVLPLLILLALLLAGLLRARANREEPALLRFEAWQLVVGLLVVLASVSAGKLPHLSPVKLVLPVPLVALLALVLLLKKRRDAANLDF